MAMGGHSYGAHSTFSAMVHTPFFREGIAGDGNNNRTLTPFSFQSERRTLWQAREVYVDISAFFHADHMQGRVTAIAKPIQARLMNDPSCGPRSSERAMVSSPATLKPRPPIRRHIRENHQRPGA
jgi:hypothetical protein